MIKSPIIMIEELSKTGKFDGKIPSDEILSFLRHPTNPARVDFTKCDLEKDVTLIYRFDGKEELEARRVFTGEEVRRAAFYFNHICEEIADVHWKDVRSEVLTAVLETWGSLSVGKKVRSGINPDTKRFVKKALRGKKVELGEMHARLAGYVSLHLGAMKSNTLIVNDMQPASIASDLEDYKYYDDGWMPEDEKPELLKMYGVLQFEFPEAA